LERPFRRNDAHYADLGIPFLVEYADGDENEV